MVGGLYLAEALSGVWRERFGSLSIPLAFKHTFLAMYFLGMAESIQCIILLIKCSVT